MSLPAPTLLAEVTYPTNGTAGPFAVPFPYLDKANVKVYVDEVATTLFTWPTTATILLNSIPVGSYILIRRETPTAPLVNVPSGTINPADINTLANQYSYLAQETQDQLAHTPRLMGFALGNLGTVPSAARASQFWANDSLGNTTLVSLAGVQAVMATTSLEVWVSKSASLASADAAAVIVGGMLVVDVNVALTGNTTLSAKTVAFRGGVITRGAFNLTINGSVMAPNVACFDKAGAGAITIGSGLALMAWFGTTANGVADDFVPMQAAVNAARAVLMDSKTYLYNGTLVIPANTTLAGAGLATKISGNNVIKMDISASGIHLCDFSFIGDGSEVITVGKNGQANNTIIERVHFVPTVANHLDRCVSLYNCNNTRIDKCNFVSTGYGIIHEASAYTVNNLKVTECYFSDMYGDAVLLNGAGGIATDVNIEANSFMGSNNWTVPATERRFVGLTSINAVKIVNNYVQNCAGDAAVHCEDVGGRLTITGNHFIDCGVSGGNDGYIYITNSNKSLILADNWFVRTSASAGTAFLSTQSVSTSGELLIHGNNFRDTSGHVVIALNISQHIGTTLINDNFCLGCDKFVYLPGASDVQIRDNTIESVSTGIYGITGAPSDIDVSDNKFVCSPDSIIVTGGSRWTVKGNNFSTGSVTGTNMTDVWMMGNTFGSGVATRTMAAGAPTRVLEVNWNFKNGTGLV